MVNGPVLVLNVESGDIGIFINIPNIDEKVSFMYSNQRYSANISVYQKS